MHILSDYWTARLKICVSKQMTSVISDIDNAFGIKRRNCRDNLLAITVDSK